MLKEIHVRGSLTPEFKAEWTAELRSGNRLQGKGRLSRIYIDNDGVKTERLCCLGVACELRPADAIKRIDAEFEVDSETNDPNGVESGKIQTVFYNGMSGMPSESFNAKHFGGDSPGFYLYWTDQFENNFHKLVTLAELNDDGLTFSQIADVIDYLY
jgi:hypothetical protein